MTLLDSAWKWDRRFLELADLVGSWSKDPSTQVGAVIVDTSNRIISTGFNGFPRGCHDTPEMLGDRNRKLLRTIHAEENALLFAQRGVQGAALYVTHPTCGRCAARVIQAGIGRVVYRCPSAAFSERWEHDMREALALYAEVALPVTVFEDL